MKDGAAAVLTGNVLYHEAALFINDGHTLRVKMFTSYIREHFFFSFIFLSSFTSHGSFCFCFTCHNALSTLDDVKYDKAVPRRYYLKTG